MQSHILSHFIVGIAITTAAIAASAFLASYLISYSVIHDHLETLFGAARTERYFRITVFESILHRLRRGSILLAIFAVILVVGRSSLVQLVQPFLRLMALSLRHLRRTRLACDVPTVLVLSLVALIAVLLRIAFLHQPMRYDEAATLLGYASKPIYLVVSLYTTPNNHLFHTLLVHTSINLFGFAEWAVRLPALAAGSLLPLLTFLLASRLGSKSAAFMAATFVATSSILIEYSVNARGYTIISGATVALLICGYETLRTASPAWFALFCLCAIAGAWTIPIFAIPFGGVVIWLVWETSARSRRFRRIYRVRLMVSCLVTALGTALVYSPVLLLNGLSRFGYLSPLSGQEFDGMDAALQSLQVFFDANVNGLYKVWQGWHRDLPEWWPLAMAAAYIYAFVAYPRWRRLVISLAGWLFLVLISRRYVPYPRIWLMFLPLYLTGCAIGLGRLFEFMIKHEPVRLRVSASFSIALIIVLGVSVLRSGSIQASTETGVLRSAREIVEFFDSRAIAADHVLCSYVSDLPLQYYWWRRTGKSQPTSAPLSVSRKADRRTIERKGIRDVWLVVNAADNETITRNLEKLGITKYTLLEQHDFSGAFVYHVTWEQARP